MAASPRPKLKEIANTPYMRFVVHCKEKPYDVYIGRGIDPKGSGPGKWGNPFPVTKQQPRKAAVLKYMGYLYAKLEQDPSLYEEIRKLKGKRLGCWCRGKYNTDRLCHGLVLAHLANTPRKRKRKMEEAPKGKPLYERLPTTYKGMYFDVWKYSGLVKQWENKWTWGLWTPGPGGGKALLYSGNGPYETKGEALAEVAAFMKGVRRAQVRSEK